MYSYSITQWILFFFCYAFIGWTVTGEGASIDDTNLTIGTEDIVLTASWKLVNAALSYSCSNSSAGSEPYLITFNGSCTMIRISKK